MFNEFVNKMLIKMSFKMIKVRRLIFFLKRDFCFKERINVVVLIKI